MNARVPMYEGDGYIRDWPRSKIRTGTDAGPPYALPLDLAELSAIEREAHRLRAVVMALMIQRFLSWIGTSIRRMFSRGDHSYMAGAKDLADVERRIKQIERREIPTA